MAVKCKCSSEVLISSSRPDIVACLYMVSEPLVTDVQEALVTIQCNNQGHYSQPYQDIYTWFDVSVLRRRSTDAKEDFESITATKSRRTIEDITQDIENFGWEFVPFVRHKPEAGGTHEVGSIRVRILKVPLSWQWRTFRISGLTTGRGVQSRVGNEKPNTLSIVQEGDRLAVWGMTQYPGWALHIQSVELCFVTVTTSPEELNRAIGSEELTSPQMRPNSPNTYCGLASETHSATESACFNHCFNPAYLLSESGLATASNQSGSLASLTNEALESSPITDSLTLLWLLAVHDGIWKVCDHSCLSTGHFHDAQDCKALEDKNSTEAHDSGTLRWVDNPCCHYAPMNPDPDFRLLRICPGADDDPLQLLLTTHAQPWSNIGYIALSYSRGSLSDTVEITLIHSMRCPCQTDDKKGYCFRQSFNITRRLHTALKWMRKQRITQPLWIDAVCIDQANLYERGRQVLAMKDIYAQALHVAIWLEISHELFGAVSALVQRSLVILREQYGDEFSYFSLTQEQLNALQKLNLCRGYPNHEPMYLLDKFLRNPWFTRVWVLQEIFRANINATIWTDSGFPMLFADLLLVMYSYHARQTLGEHGSGFFAQTKLWNMLGRRHSQGGDRIQVHKRQGGVFLEMKTADSDGQFNASKEFPILRLFSHIMPFKAPDPRDKLFGILGLAQETGNNSSLPIEILPDYTKSDSQVFVDFSRYCIKTSKTLDLFSIVSKSARPINIPDQDIGIVANDYPFPPSEHPSWAIWYAQKAKWTSEVSFAPAYPDTFIANDREVDTELLELSSTPAQLPLLGIKLDEVETTFSLIWRDIDKYEAVVIRGHSSENACASPQLVWDYFQGVFRERRTTGQLSTYHSEEDLFNAVLLTMLCSSNLPASVRDFSVTQEQRQKPFDDDKVMSGVVAYWIMSHPDVRAQLEKQTGSGKPKVAFDPVIEELFRTLPHNIAERFKMLMLKMLKDSTFIRMERKGRYDVHHMRGRVPFTTKRGYIGLCPVGTNPGDRTVALWGAHFASVIRPNNDGETIEHSVNKKGWTLVGEAFVHAWLDGHFVAELLTALSEELYVLV